MLFSIVVATYNSAKTLERCLGSIVPQLGDDSELIIIDGGSNDGTVNIINNFIKYISYTVSEPDKGVYDAWNKAVVKAHGTWITFIGSDDMLLPDAIEKYRSFFKKCGDNFDIVSGKIHYVDKDYNLKWNVGEPFSWEKLVNVRLKLAHPGMLHNRSCFERFGLFDTRYKICGDSDFLQRLGKDVRAGYIDDFLVNMTEGGLSNSLGTIREGFLIRYRNHSINKFKLFYLFGWMYLRFILGKVKNRIVSHNR